MRRSIILFVLLLVVSAVPALAQYDYGFKFRKTGSSGLQFLKIGVGAREAAMGEAASVIANDVNAAFWNPSGLAFVDGISASASHMEWLAGSQHSAASIALPVRRLVVGVSMITFGIEEFEETTVDEPDGTGRMVSAGDMLVGLTVARRFTERLVIGAQLKYAHEKLDTQSHGNILMDIGTQYDTGFRNLRLGFSLQHFGPDMKVADISFRTPLLFRLAAADEIVDTEQVRLTATAELVHPTDNLEWVNTGLELTLFKSLMLRGGYRFNADQMNLSGGFGLVTPETSLGRLNLDYAYVPTGTVFANIHRFSVRFRL